MEQKQKPERAMTDWISVKDRLPEDEQPVLVLACSRWMDVLHYVAGKGWYPGGLPICNSTHWQPLPEPPKEADHD